MSAPSDDLSPRVKRVIAPNPGAFTGPGTNTYLVGTGKLRAIIDPGPENPAHIDRIMEALEHEEASTDLILVTHSHPDHLPGARILSERTGAPIAADGRITGVTRPLAHGQRIPLSGCSVEALYTPGHAGDHYCFLLLEEGALFSGDLILGRGSVTVRDMDAYLASLRALRQYGIRSILPGHWDPVDDAERKITEYIDHRLEREQQVLAALRAGDRTPAAIAQRIYPVDLDPRLRAASRASVAAHLASLERRGVVRTFPGSDPPEYELVPGTV